MKILHITATHMNNVGGIPLVLNGLITNQNKIKGVESRLLSLNAKINEYNNTHFYNKPSDIEQWIKEYNPDVVILHSFYHIDYIIISNILTKLKIKYYIEPHGSFVKNSFNKSAIKKKIANLTIFRKLLKNALGYIYLSQQELDNSIYHKKNDIIIPNAINANTLESDKSNNITYYFIGRYDIREKGIDVLLDAFNILDEEQFKIDFSFYGYGSNKENNYINKRIKRYKYLKIRNEGQITGNDKNRTISKKSIMILTSRHEGFPMTVLEALNAGTPCIVSRESNISDLIEKNDLGWVVSIDKNIIANTIKKSFYDYKKDKEKYYNRCKNIINNNYRWEKIAKLSISELRKNIKGENE